MIKNQIRIVDIFSHSTNNLTLIQEDLGLLEDSLPISSKKTIIISQ